MVSHNLHDELRDAGLVDVSALCPGIVCDIRYATPDNLTGEALYSTGSCYLREEVAEALDRVRVRLQAQGIGLKIWDAYRPMSIQARLVAFVNNTDYTPDVSNHSRGIALDVTLINLESGKELVMPTEHDDLSEAAHQDADVTNPVVLKNRELLKSAMHAEGFKVYPYEWWHFDFVALASADPLDIAI